jgi:hypothetical protein
MIAVNKPDRLTTGLDDPSKWVRAEKHPSHDSVDEAVVCQNILEMPTKNPQLENLRIALDYCCLLCVMIPAVWRRTMRIDLYTKTILTLITLLLAAILLKPIVHPQLTIAQENPNAHENLSGIQFSAAVGGFYAFDTSTGDIWAYNLASGGCAHFKLTKLGKPLTR